MTGPIAERALDRMLRHDAWATRRLLEHCRALEPGQFHRTFEIGPGSLHDTLAHVIGAMMRWADRLADRPERVAPPPDPRGGTPAALLVLLGVAADDLADVARQLVRDGRLDETMTLRVRDAPEPIRFTRATALVHVLTHGTHHRAQALNMLRHLGVVDLPEIDAIECEIRPGA